MAITAGLQINSENFVIVAAPGCSGLPRAAGAARDLRCEQDCLRREEAGSNETLLLGKTAGRYKRRREVRFRVQKCQKRRQCLTSLSSNF